MTIDDMSVDEITVAKNKSVFQMLLCLCISYTIKKTKLVRYLTVGGSAVVTIHSKHCLQP
jgi:hypothetical protein